MRRCARVEQWIKTALAKDVQSVVLKLHWADLQEVRGKYQDVEAIYRSILQQDPQNVAALNNQAWLLAQENAEFV